MKWLVDIGNTRVKWACSHGYGATLSGHGAFSYEPDALRRELEQRWPDERPLGLEQALIASVAGPEVTGRVRDFITSAWSVKVEEAVAETARDGLKNGYDDPASLGVDRWLALLAAWRKYETSLCVIDCGTTITVDIVLHEGQHLGGRHLGGHIYPGLAAHRKALAMVASQIQADDDAVPTLAFGRSTSEGVSNSYAFALSGMLRECLEKVRKEHGAELLAVITGGGAEALPSSLLPALVRHEPDLVLQGLNLLR